MKQVLLSFVGDQDPCSQKTQEEGSVVTLCRHLHVDEVHLMPSAKLPDVYSSTEKGAYETKEWLQECVRPDLMRRRWRLRCRGSTVPGISVI